MICCYFCDSEVSSFVLKAVGYKIILGDIVFVIFMSKIMIGNTIMKMFYIPR